MATFEIIKPINWGPWTIADKNFGPDCLSCHAPINNYAPKVGQTIEGNLEVRQYKDANKQLQTGRGVLYEIKTNGPASTQAQTSTQFITEDHLRLTEEPVNPVEPPLPPPNPEVVEPNSKPCWICDNIGYILIVVLIVVILIGLLNRP